ncbi:hypothetical protein EON65_02670 [archaeon]|nr:MAG: hypothetical protein EON65_02670 [archaeon]
MEEESEASSHGDECKPLSNGEYEVEVTTRLSKAEKKKLKEERKLEKVRRRLLHRKENKKAKKQRHSGEEVSDEKPVVLKSDLAAKLQHGMECGQNVCIDLYFEDQHLQKEKSSIATQLVLLYAFLKRSEVPIHLSLCSLDPTSFVFSSLQKQGMDHWYMDKHSAGVEQIFPKDRLVYLSPDATEVLETIEADKVSMFVVLIS